MPGSELDELPDWPPGTVAVLATGAGEPHAIPVSTCVRAGPRTVLLALARRRESLQRLRRDPRCALTLLAGGNVALSAVGRATVVQEAMAVADTVAAVRIEIARVLDHRQGTFEIRDGVRWEWIDAGAAERDAAIRAALMELGRAGDPTGPPARPSA